MIILDTDIISLLDRKSGEAFKEVSRRLAAVPDDERVCSTIISFEEHMRGWLAQIAAARKPEAQVIAYTRLQRLLGEYQFSIKRNKPGAWSNRTKISTSLPERPSPRAVEPNRPSELKGGART